MTCNGPRSRIPIENNLQAKDCKKKFTSQMGKSQTTQKRKRMPCKMQPAASKSTDVKPNPILLDTLVPKKMVFQLKQTPVVLLKRIQAVNKAVVKYRSDKPSLVDRSYIKESSNGNNAASPLTEAVVDVVEENIGGNVLPQIANKSAIDSGSEFCKISCNTTFIVKDILPNRNTKMEKNKGKLVAEKISELTMPLNPLSNIHNLCKTQDISTNKHTRQAPVCTTSKNKNELFSLRCVPSKDMYDCNENLDIPKQDNRASNSPFNLESIKVEEEEVQTFSSMANLDDKIHFGENSELQTTENNILCSKRKGTKIDANDREPVVKKIKLSNVSVPLSSNFQSLNETGVISGSTHMSQFPVSNPLPCMTAIKEEQEVEHAIGTLDKSDHQIYPYSALESPISGNDIGENTSDDDLKPNTVWLEEAVMIPPSHSYSHEMEPINCESNADLANQFSYSLRPQDETLADVFIWCTLHEKYQCRCNSAIMCLKTNIVYWKPTTNSRYLSKSCMASIKISSDKPYVGSLYNLDEDCARTFGSLFKYATRNKSHLYKKKSLYDCRALDTITNSFIRFRRADVRILDFSECNEFEDSDVDVNENPENNNLEEHTGPVECSPVISQNLDWENVPNASYHSNGVIITPFGHKLISRAVITHGVLCITPGVGYLPVMNFSTTSLSVRHPLHTNDYYRFKNIYEVENWLNSFFKRRFQFDPPDLRMKWIVVTPGIFCKHPIIGESLLNKTGGIITKFGVYSKDKCDDCSRHNNLCPHGNNGKDSPGSRALSCEGASNRCKSDVDLRVPNTLPSSLVGPKKSNGVNSRAGSIIVINVPLRKKKYQRKNILQNLNTAVITRQFNLPVMCSTTEGYANSQFDSK